MIDRDSLLFRLESNNEKKDFYTKKITALDEENAMIMDELSEYKEEKKELFKYPKRGRMNDT